MSDINLSQTSDIFPTETTLTWSVPKCLNTQCSNIKMSA